MRFFWGEGGSQYLFNLYSEAILTKLESLPGCIIDRHNLNISSENDPVLIGDTERKLQVLPDKILKKNEIKWLTVHCAVKEDRPR